MKVKFNVKRYFQVLGISLGIVLIASFVVLGFNYTKLDLMQEEVDNTSTVAAANGKINVLLMGTDIDGLRTDAIMLASYDTEKNKVDMLSIPRDTRMYIGNRYQKINAAHAFEKDGVIGGPTATCEAVTRITGIPINYYIDFSFEAVAQVIDELGPVDFTVPDIYGDGVGMVYDDPVQGLHINLPPGDYQLNGQQVIWLLRYRHGNPDPNTGVFKSYPNGDADRVEMQQKFLKALVDQKVNASLILKLPAIFKDVSSNIKTNFTTSDIVKYSKYLTNFSSTDITTHQLPGEYGEDPMNGDVWNVDLEKTRELVRDVFGYDANDITIDEPSKSGSTSTTQPVSTKAPTSETKSQSDTSSDKNTSSGSSTSGSASSSGSSSGKSSSSSSGSSSASSSSSSSTSGSTSSSSSSSGKSSGSSSSSSGENSSSGQSKSSDSGESYSFGTSEKSSSENSSSGSSSSSESAVRSKNLDDDE